MGSAKASRNMRDMTLHRSAMKLLGNRPDTLQLMSAMLSISKAKYSLQNCVNCIGNSILMTLMYLVIALTIVKHCADVVP
jgi:hypothetical protein